MSETYLPGMPAPEATELDREYWEAAKRHELAVQICAACGAAKWPPEEICSQCHSFERSWVRASGNGRIYSWTRAWHPVHPALAEYGPYLVVVVQLDDFPVLHIGNLLGDPMEDVTAGMPVEAVFEDHPGGYTLVQWRLAR
jgi:uncharacterized protein